MRSCPEQLRGNQTHDAGIVEKEDNKTLNIFDRIWVKYPNRGYRITPVRKKILRFLPLTQNKDFLPIHSDGGV